MKRTFVALAVLALQATTSAHAKEAIATDGASLVRITDDPCELELPDADKQRAAWATVDGITYRGCWTERNRQILLRYEDGDMGLIPATSFHTLLGA